MAGGSELDTDISDRIFNATNNKLTKNGDPWISLRLFKFKFAEMNY